MTRLGRVNSEAGLTKPPVFSSWHGYRGRGCGGVSTQVCVEPPPLPGAVWLSFSPASVLLEFLVLSGAAGVAWL